jgi:hypothetical protein
MAQLDNYDGAFKHAKLNCSHARAILANESTAALRICA